MSASCPHYHPAPSREHLTPAEVEKLIEALHGNRHGHRDALMAPAGGQSGRPAQAGEGATGWAQLDSRDQARRLHH
jgi:hypothetical protein